MAVDPTSASAVTQATGQVAGAIRQAARSTGASFDYLLATAKLESNLNPSAQASTSSAKGLFQFIEQTWLSTMKSAGPGLGYSGYADAISYNANSGRYEVSDPGMRDAIMKLRGDPAASAAMAGAFTRGNMDQLQGALGRPPTDGELYIAHFLGPDGATRLIGAATNRPNASAADLFPGAAGANRSIFYDRAGNARSTEQVYAVLANKFDKARMAAGASGQGDVTAAAQIGPTFLDRLPPMPRDRVASVTAPDTAGVTQAYAEAGQREATRALRVQPVRDDRPLFQAMFTARDNNPIAPVVQALWTDTTSSAAPTSASAPPQPAGIRPLDLFRDMGPGGPNGPTSRG